MSIGRRVAVVTSASGQEVKFIRLPIRTYMSIIPLLRSQLFIVKSFSQLPYVNQYGDEDTDSGFC